jgi:hypothetical protein
MMLGKTLMNLDETARALDPDFNPPAALREQLSSVLQWRVGLRAPPKPPASAPPGGAAVALEWPSPLRRGCQR